MSKTLRTLAICLAALVLLAGSYAAVLAIFPEEEDAPVSSENASSQAPDEPTPLTYIYERDVNDFVSAEITSVESGVYHIREEGTGYRVDELDGIEVYNAMIESCAERLSAYPYNELISEAPTAEELEEYGLITPAAKAVVTFEDGTETLYVGNKDEDGYYYVRREGDETVYSTATGISGYFVKGHVSFINTSLFYCAEDNRAGVDNFVFTDALADDPVCIGKSDTDSKSAMAISSAYCITAPLVMAADTEKLDTGLTELCKFSAEQAVAIVGENGDLSPYGLDDPRYTLEFTYQKPLTDTEISEGKEENDNPVSRHKFIMSAPDEDGVIYVKDTRSSVVMSFAAGIYSFMDWTLDNMAGELFLSPMIKYLDRIEIAFSGRDYIFELTPGDGSIVKVTYGGTDLDVDNFKKFYQVILGTGRIGIGQAEEGAAEHMSVRFVYLEDLEKEDDVLTFKEYSIRQYAAEVNGVGRFTVAKTRIDKLENDLDKVIKNQPVNAFMN